MTNVLPLYKVYRYSGRLLAMPAFIVTWLTMLAAPPVLAQNDPIIRVTPQQGILEYRKGERDWALVIRPKYLFQGYSARTGPGSSAVVQELLSGNSSVLNAQSEIVISDTEIDVLQGELVSSQPQTNSLIAGLTAKFREAQRFTTVRRQGPCDEQIRTANRIVLADNYPSLVWRNACPEYSYRLRIDNQEFDIPASTDDDYIEFDVPEQNPGEYDYQVEVLENGRVIYSPRQTSTLIWQDAAAMAETSALLQDIGEDGFLAASAFDNADLLVPALKSMESYIADNEGDAELLPFLIMSYGKLGLVNLQSDATRQYQDALGGQ